MDNTSHTLPYLSSCPNTFGGYLPFPSSPHKICSNGSLLISADSLPSPPISLSPATAESIQSTSPLSHYTRSQCFKEQNIQGLSPEYASDQDDLTCLSWLHQRGNLLPLQPLSKMTLLPPLESSAPVQSVPSSSCKPPYSFTCMIFMAIEDSPNKRLPVKDIYEWIVNNFPYYKSASGGWRNSVRHNLSLSKSFHRIQRDKHQSVGKGSLWCVCPEYRPALLDLLKKTHKFQSNNCNLINKPALLEAADYGMTSMCDTVDISESLSQTLLNTPSPQLTANDPNLCENPTCLLTPDHEELITVEPVEYKQEEAIVEMELELEMEKDPLLDSGYVELHYYQSDQYQYLVLPNDTQLDLETVEILQLDTEAQEAAGSLLDLAGGGY
ncbi:forkhead box protein N3-like [Thalassophryne amazonica]|uniref:forkhead box protein N3-like n=1 Tax=Thalassophryne amazonica TaxID=390379 RepID=UPI001471C5D8|nr:forkhead box protein N3-like [Thalassophryne amazonica]XP_034038014.1 forkhead box protein N3-like [Thalassophryne amazonica]XP_034038015.1 forkhead box protein N3-like [Thalassophryne amazonica]